jgi:hypothetical protein
MKEGLDLVKGALAMWVRGRGSLNTVSVQKLEDHPTIRTRHGPGVGAVDIEPLHRFGKERGT